MQVEIKEHDDVPLVVLSVGEYEARVIRTVLEAVHDDIDIVTQMKEELDGKQLTPFDDLNVVAISHNPTIIFTPITEE